MECQILGLKLMMRRLEKSNGLEALKMFVLCFYKKLINTLPIHVVKSETNYNLEYLWPSILHFNSELKVGTNDCL